jgi:hypothetical protein
MSLPAAYQAQKHQLAVGFEPVDQLRAQRTASPVVISVESPEGVVHRPNRRFADISNQSDTVPRVGRGEYGTHRMLYLKRNPMPTEMLIRVSDERRHFIPRRFRLNVPASVDAESEQRPLTSRKQSPLLFPAAAYQVSESSTGLRGRVLRNAEPMRWAWISAYYLINTGTNENPQFLRRGLIGRAISDDRGEFLLVLNTMPISDAGIADLSNPIWVNVVVNGPSPAPSGINLDDPLWDVPIESLPSAGEADPAVDEDYIPTGYAADLSPQGNKNIPFRLGDFITGFEVEDFVCNLL